MAVEKDLDVFIDPKSVAVIGATERPGAWGSFIMESLLIWNYPGKIYPVNRNAGEVYGIPSFPDIESIKGPVDLAIMAIPKAFVEETVKTCGRKGFRGITIITAGFGEAVEGGWERETAVKHIARSYGMHVLGPNVSGTFNLHARFNASGSPADFLFPSSLAAVCQGGYAFYDLMASAFAKKMGIGKFIHTGNECDLQVTDFLAYFGSDPEVKGILMYLETLRDGHRFIDVAKQVTKEKPIVVYKAGRTDGGTRAARSHTGALGGRRGIFEGAFSQADIIVCPTMELIIPLGHALVERPPMRGKRVAIMTMGGSWGVALTDCLEEEGLTVPAFSPGLQTRLKELGMPPRASTKNPVDIGAAGAVAFERETLLEMGRLILLSEEMDALILLGFGRPGMLEAGIKTFNEEFSHNEKSVMQGFNDLENELGRPVIVGSCLGPWESQAVHELNNEGVRILNRLDEIACILSRMYQYWSSRSGIQ